MVQLGALSRRALVAAAAPAARGPGAEARRRKPPPPPLAFVKAVITDVGQAASGGGFSVSFVAWLHHPGATPINLSGQTEVAAATGATQVRAFVATALRSKASIALEPSAAVPPDRVSVVLF
jgi:hypothetical protein